MEEKFSFWYWEKVLNQDQIKQTNLLCEKYHDIFHEDQSAENVVKTADVKGIKWELLKPVINHVDLLWRERNNFTFGFNLFHTLDVDMWNINTYDSKNNGEYDLHYDSTRDHTNDIKLTGIVNISDEPYEGGEFIAFVGNQFQEIPEIKNPGSSILLRHGILHKVNPVTKGTRKTISHWLYGPRFI